MFEYDEKITPSADNRERLSTIAMSAVDITDKIQSSITPIVTLVLKDAYFVVSGWKTKPGVVILTR
jgi:hypothetical protein